MNSEKKLKVLIDNAIEDFQNGKEYESMETFNQVEMLAEALDLEKMVEMLKPLRVELAFSRLTNHRVNEFASEYKLYPMRGKNKIVLDYSWYGSSPERVAEVKRAMDMQFKAYVLPYSVGIFKIGKPLKITPLDPNETWGDALFRVEVPIVLL